MEENKHNIKVTDKKFLMNKYLRSNLNSIIYNAQDDWDFIFIITGSGKTRVGKSMLASQVAYYLSYCLKTPFSIENNLVFDGYTLIQKAMKLPKNSVIVYDEARAEMEAKKSIYEAQNYIYDFFAECGMLNHIIILVMPCFFELQKRIAINRSICLINLFYERDKRKMEIDGVKEDVIKFTRGKFRFYNEHRKKLLYIKGIRNFDDYKIVGANFWGSYPNKFMYDTKKYEAMKIEFLKRERKRKGLKFEKQRNALLYYMNKDLKMPMQKISNVLKAKGIVIARKTISDYIISFQDGIDGGVT